MQCKFSVVIDNCVSGVTAALKANDNVRLGSNDVSNFTFTFVSPISTNNSFNHKDIHPPLCRLSK